MIRVAPLLLAVACAPAWPAADIEQAAVGVEVAPSVWPAEGTVLVPPVVELPHADRRFRVFLDAGHGASGNTGNRNWQCEDEADVMFDLAADLEGRLEATGQVDVRVGRERGRPRSYQRRLAEAEAWRADVLISLHSDARGWARPRRAPNGRTCLGNGDEPGFSVLYHALRGAPETIEGRTRLARSLGLRLAAAGLLPYHGEGYVGQYGVDPIPGVFTDQRHLFFLKRPTMPSVILETHHALDSREATRLEEARTRDVLARVILMAVADTLQLPPAEPGLPRAWTP